LQLVVIDNFSADETPTIPPKYADVFQQAGPERSRQRNLGAGLAIGEYLLFIDSDMVLQTSVVEDCLAEVARGAGAVIVPEVSFGEGYWSACKALERSCYVGDDTIEAPRFIQGILFRDLAGYDEELVAGEDWDLAERIRGHGARIGRIETPILHDQGHLSLWETMRAKYYYGLSMPRYIRKHPNVARRQLTLLRPAFVKHHDILTSHPTLTAGMLFMKTCEAAAGGLGAVVGWHRGVA